MGHLLSTSLRPMICSITYIPIQQSPFLHCLVLSFWDTVLPVRALQQYWNSVLKRKFVGMMRSFLVYPTYIVFPNLVRAGISHATTMLTQLRSIGANRSDVSFRH